jgi:Flp pilus assembly protein TadG
MAQVNSAVGRLKSERGAELIEFALIFPILLLVVVGIIDFGFLFQRFEVLTNATREGARMAVLPNYTEADVQARVCAYLNSGGVPNSGCTTNPVVTVTDADIPVGGGLPPIQARRVQVAYTHNFMFMGPIVSLVGGTWTNTRVITTEAIMRTEIQATTPTP